MPHDTAPPTHELPVAADPPAEAALALDRFRAEALSLPAEAVVRWFGTPSRLHDNLRRGAVAVLAERAGLAADLPQANWAEVERAPDLAIAAWQAFAVADRTVAVAARPYAEHRESVALARKNLLATAAYLATSGGVDEAALEAVRRGNGAGDSASDVLALCDLLEKAGPAAAALTRPADLTKARAEATTLLARLRPAGRLGDTGKQGEALAAADLRDRVFTLALRAHRELWRVGAWQWGPEVDQHVPGVQTRRV